MPQPLRVVFMGSPEFALPALRAIHAAGHAIVGVYTQPDRPSGRGQRTAEPPVKRLAAELGLPVFQPVSMKRPEEVGRLRELAPDVAVVAAFGQILPPAVIDVPRLGILNVHASLLPRHRGASPVPGAILAGDRDTGVTIMLIDPGLDTGPMLAKRATPIDDDDTAATLLDRLSGIGADLLLETLPRWAAGEIAGVPQDDTLATLDPPLRKEQGRIDWSEPAQTIWRRVRAFNPWPVATTMLAGEPVRILEAWHLPGTRGAPGEIVPLDGEALDGLGPRRGRAGFGVGTGEGLLVPLLVQKAGRRPVDAASFARGERVLIGSRLASPTAAGVPR